MAEFLPITMFTQRNDDELRVEGRGQNDIPSWYLKGNNLQERSMFLADGLQAGLALERHNEDLPYLFNVKLDGRDTAKSKRKAIAGMLHVSPDPNVPDIVGMRGSIELIVQAKDRPAVQRMIDNVSDTERNVAGISCVTEIKPFKLRVETDSPNAHNRFKVRLVDYKDDEINSRCQAAFKRFLDGTDLEYESIEYTDDLLIFDVKGSPEEAAAIADGIMGESLFSILPMPNLSATLDALDDTFALPKTILPEEGSEYPVLGILDSGIEPIAQLSPWIVGQRQSSYIESDIDASHGTFVAGVATYGDELEGAEWVGGLKPMIFDAAVFPDEKAVGPVPESEVVANIKETLDRFHDMARVWNLSISGAGAIEPDCFSDFAAVIDDLQSRYGILICKSAGNTKGFLSGTDKDALAKGADSVLALTVGSAAHHKEPNDIADIGDASPFSCIGPGPEYITKPEVSHYGGNAGVKANGVAALTPVRSFSTQGTGASSVGTSFSTPRVAALASNLDFALGEQSDPLLVKALIAHSASFLDGKILPADEKVRELGFGIPGSLSQILSDNPYESTLVLRGRLDKGDYIDIMDYPVPPSLVREGMYSGQIILTLAYNPILDASQGGEYCQSDIDVKFGTYDEKEERPIDRPGFLNPIGRTGSKNLLKESLYSRKRMKAAEDEFALMERMLIQHEGKYSPVKKYALDLSDLKPSNMGFIDGEKQWYLYIKPQYRYNAEVEAVRESRVLSQEFCVIVTVRDPLKSVDVYDQTRQLLNARNFMHNPIKLRNEVRAKIES